MSHIAKFVVFKYHLSAYLSFNQQTQVKVISSYPIAYAITRLKNVDASEYVLLRARLVVILGNTFNLFNT